MNFRDTNLIKHYQNALKEGEISRRIKINTVSTNTLGLRCNNNKKSLFSNFIEEYKQLTAIPRKIRLTLQRKWMHSLAAITVLLALGAGNLSAATINVDETSPGSGIGVVAVDNSDNFCSLPEAVISANNDNSAGNGCEDGSGPDEIVLPLNSTFTFDGINPVPFSDDELGFSALPVVRSEITIVGNNSTIQRVVANDPCNLNPIPNMDDSLCFRLIENDADSQISILILNDITLTGGNGGPLLTTDKGGAIFTGENSRLTLNNTTITNNFANIGGGIYANTTFSGAVIGGEIIETINIINSNISNNRATVHGGGIAAEQTPFLISNSKITNNTNSGILDGFGGGIFYEGSVVNIIDSTISENSAVEGGGLHDNGFRDFFSFSTKITRSTISGNNALRGGGFYLSQGSSFEISNSTIYGNTANLGGGIEDFSSTSSNLVTNSVINSTISGNIANGVTTNNGFGGIFISSVPVNISNTIISENIDGLGNVVNCGGGGQFNNLGNNLSDDSTCNFGTGNNNAVISLDILSNNGGPTQTLALLPGSSAIDTGSNSVCNSSPVDGVDQRGFPRPSGTNCDIGAFEVLQEPFIKITKLTDPTIMGSEFPFTLDGSTLSTVFDLSDGEIFSSVLSEDTFTLTESNPPDFIVKTVECTDDSIVPVITIDNDSDPSLMIDFTVVGTDKLECTVTNTNDISNLDVVTDGSGTGTVTGTGIDCPTECSELVPNGVTITLTAIPAVGSQFAGFSGAGCNGNSPLDIDVAGDINCTATFNDINNCVPNPCNNGGTCTDTGTNSFSCNCDGTGFEGVTCDADINECTDGTDNCDVNATCTNTPGSFTCECNAGFEGDGTSCTEIDACVNNPCDVNASCTDLPPPAADNAAGRTCDCNTGFEGNGETCTVVPADDDDDDNNDSIDPEVDINPGSGGPIVSINFGPGLGGGGQILVDIPPDVIAEFATLSPNVGTCEIVNPTSAARVTDPDVICDINQFPEDLDLFLNLCRETNVAGIEEVVVEVIADNAPNEEFEEAVELILNQIRLCSAEGDDTGDTDGTADSSDNGCSIAEGPLNTKSSIINFLVTFFPALFGFVGLFRRELFIKKK